MPELCALQAKHDNIFSLLLNTWLLFKLVALVSAHDSHSHSAQPHRLGIDKLLLEFAPSLTLPPWASLNHISFVPPSNIPQKFRPAP